METALVHPINPGHGANGAQAVALPDPVEELVFPEEDGVPMPETGLHFEAGFYLVSALRSFLSGRDDVLVGSNQFLYWDPQRPDQVVAPDIYVILGVSPEPRPT